MGSGACHDLARSAAIPAVSRFVFGGAWRIGAPLVLIAGWIALWVVFLAFSMWR